jgi:hypothetical protein
LLRTDKVAAAILLIAILSGLHAEGLFLAEAHGAEAVGRDAQGDEVLLNGTGATVAEREVVFGRAALVAMAFDREANLRVLTKEIASLA